MAQAVVEDCALAIAGAGYSCYDYTSAGLTSDHNKSEIQADLASFGESAAPVICDFINGFIKPTLGTWTVTFEGATAIIDAIKKALSDPRKIAKAIRKIINLAKSILEKIKAIIEFIINIPNAIEDYLLKQYRDVVDRLEAYVEQLEEEAVAKCVAKKTEILNRLQNKLQNADTDAQRARIQAKIDSLNGTECRNLALVVPGNTFEWPTIPDLVFGLGNILQAIIDGITIPLPNIRLKMPLIDRPDISYDAINGKIDEISEWANAKVDGLNKFVEPFVASYNTIAEFLNMLLSLDLKGILKWLLSFPKKFIDIHLNMARFALKLVLKGIIPQNPLGAIEDWARDKFDNMIRKMKERANSIDPIHIDALEDFDTSFFDKVGELISEMRNGANAVADWIEDRVNAIGGIAASYIEYASKIYGLIIGGISYAVSIIVSDVAPLLAIVGMSASLLAPTVNSNPDPDGEPRNINGASNDSDYITVYKQDEYVLDIDTNGVPIPVDVSGIAVGIDPSTGTYYTPSADRPIVQYGYFIVTAAGIRWEDPETENFVRVNSASGNGWVATLFPLIDPIEPEIDLASWKEFNIDYTRSRDLRSPVIDDLTVYGSGIVTVREHLYFLGIPEYGAPPATQTPSGIDMSEYLVSGQGMSDVTDTLDSPGDVTRIVQRYQGRFYYRRWLEYTELPIVNEWLFTNRLGHPPIYEPIITELEYAQGFYEYSSFDHSIRLNIMLQRYYTGPVGETPQSFNFPNEEEARRVFYRGESNLDGNYENIGKIYVVNDEYYRIGLFDNSNSVSPAFQPQQTGYEWHNYTTPARYRFTNANTDDITEILLGGMSFRVKDLITIDSSLLITPHFDTISTPGTLESVYLYIKNENDVDFIQFDGLNRQYNAITLVSGVNQYYYQLNFSNVSGVIGNRTNPNEIVI